MKTLLSIVAICSVLGACSTDNVSPRNAAASAAAFDALTLKRTACYGTCPVYTVQILGNGQVTFTGQESVTVKGIRQSSMPQSDVELLGAALRHAGFEQLRTQYVSEKDGCLDVPTDMPSLSVSVTTGAKTKEVVLYAGCRGPTVPADDLYWLANTIDAMARTHALIN